MSNQEPTGKGFKVEVDVQLPEEALARIDRAIQKAVLHELADTDVANGYSVIMRHRGPAHRRRPPALRLGGGGRPRLGAGRAAERPALLLSSYARLPRASEPASEPLHQRLWPGG